MRKTLIFIITIIAICTCFLGCKNQSLIITDADKIVQKHPSINIHLAKSIEPKSQIQVITNVIDENTYQMTCYFNHIEIQKADNVLKAFDDAVTFHYQYVVQDDYMPYYLYTPSSVVDSNQRFPLIVWLHGSGEQNVNENTFKNRGLPAVLNNWTLSGFNAYVLCPQLAGKYSGSWNNETSQQYLKMLLDKFIAENNVNPKKVVICGHSLGGQGSLYMAKTMPEYFQACISLSPYNPGISMENVSIPVIGYSETGLSYAETMQNLWGEECLIYLPTSHGNIPNMAFNLDENNNNCSDLVEWIFSQINF